VGLEELGIVNEGKREWKSQEEPEKEYVMFQRRNMEFKLVIIHMLLNFSAYYYLIILTIPAMNEEMVIVKNCIISPYLGSLVTNLSIARPNSLSQIDQRTM